MKKVLIMSVLIIRGHSISKNHFEGFRNVRLVIIFSDESNSNSIETDGVGKSLVLVKK